MSKSVLSPETQVRLEFLFNEEHRAEATRLLLEECGNNLPFCEDLSSHNLDRIRFAALKLSEGNLPKLHEAINLAKLDWRDLLMAAGFGRAVKAHESWMPSAD